MYQAFGLEGGGARRQAAFWGVGVSQLPPGLASVPLSRCSRGVDGVTQFQQLLSGPGDVIWATRLGESVPKSWGWLSPPAGTPLPSPHALGTSRSPRNAIGWGFPSPTLPGNPPGWWPFLFCTNLPVPTTGRVQSIQVVPRVSLVPRVQAVGVVMLSFDVGGFSLSRKQTLTSRSAHRNQCFRGAAVREANACLREGAVILLDQATPGPACEAGVPASP